MCTIDNGLGSMLKAVNSVLAIVKGKLKPSNEISNENFLRIYQRVINYIGSLVLVVPKMIVQFPSPLPPTLENVPVASASDPGECEHLFEVYESSLWEETMIHFYFHSFTRSFVHSFIRSFHMY